MLLMQCTKEGPMGPPGADGEDGMDGNVTCMECHSTDVQDAINLQFQQSVHSAGAIAVDYAGGRVGCSECHSHEGFVEFAATGDVAGTITNPGAWQCKTCHNIHATFEVADYAFRLADAVTFIFDETTVFDAGNSNLCANCHQSRRAEPNMDIPGATYEITSTHYGPHHGAQANILMGVGFAEIPGDLSYPTDGSSSHMAEDGRCTGCHMYDYAEGEGGHTFNPSLASCNACHTGSSTDFDYGGVQTETEELLIELRDLLIAHEVLEYVELDDAYEPIPGEYDMVLVQAFFNWVGLEEDRSLGVHNPQYVKALLQNSIDAVNAL
jgi:hypothetical protein